MLAMGYGPPLPAPIPAVQTTLSAIDLPELHKFVQESDTTTLADCDEEDVHQPLLIDSLDLSLWTSLFVTTTTDPNRTMHNIKSAHTKLGNLLMQDEHEITKSIGVSSIIEEALKLANTEMLESSSARSIAELDTEITAAAAIPSHPLLTRLKISSAERSTLEDFTENLNTSQAEKDNHAMVNTK